MTNYLKICKEECNKDMTKDEVIHEVQCSFCDVPYILMGESVE